MSGVYSLDRCVQDHQDMRGAQIPPSRARHVEGLREDALALDSWEQVVSLESHAQ